MPTVAELERLEALIKLLAPLANVQRGDVISAQNWNTIVNALIDVARAVLAEERAAVVPAHEHSDQVSVGWLDAKLRTLLERGPLADPAAVTQLGELDRRLTRLSGRIEDVNSGVKVTHDRVVEVATRDLVRESSITQVQRKVEGLSDGRDDIRTLRETLRSVQDNLQVALDVGSKLNVGGQPVDMANLVSRLQGLEDLRQRLTMPDGTLLDAGALERRLTSLTNTLVTEEELNQALKDRPGTITDTQVSGLQETLRASLVGDFNTTTKQQVDLLRTDVDQRLAGIDTLVGRAVSDALPGMSQTLLNQVRPEIAAAVKDSAAQTQAWTTAALKEATTGVAADFSQKLGDLQLGLAASIRTELDRQLPPQLDALKSQLAQLGQRIGTVETSQTAQGTQLQNLAVQSQTLAANLAQARLDLEKKITDVTGQSIAALRSEVNAQFDKMSASLNDQMKNMVSDATRSILDQVKSIATDIVTTNISITANQLRGEMHTVARDEIATFQGQLPGLISAQVEQAFTRVPGVVSQEVRLQMADLPTLVNQQIQAFQLTINDQVTRAIANQMPAVVKSMFGTQVDAMIKESLASQMPTLLQTSLNRQLSPMVEELVKKFHTP